jgi:hypothetical protein
MTWYYGPHADGARVVVLVCGDCGAQVSSGPVHGATPDASRAAALVVASQRLAEHRAGCRLTTSGVRW